MWEGSVRGGGVGEAVCGGRVGQCAVGRAGQWGGAVCSGEAAAQWTVSLPELPPEELTSRRPRPGAGLILSSEQWELTGSGLPRAPENQDRPAVSQAGVAR